MVNSKQTWINIKEEYEQGIKEFQCAWALCTLSKTFKTYWEEYVKKIIIRKFAQEFLETRDEIDTTSNFLLFYCNESRPIEEEKQIRLNFINYMIEQFDEEVQVNS